MSVPVSPMYARHRLRRSLWTVAHALLTVVMLLALALACCSESVAPTLALGALAAVAYGLRLLLERRA